jgi:hypothetical protein
MTLLWFFYVWFWLIWIRNNCLSSRCPWVTACLCAPPCVSLCACLWWSVSKWLCVLHFACFWASLCECQDVSLGLYMPPCMSLNLCVYASLSVLYACVFLGLFDCLCVSVFVCVRNRYTTTYRHVKRNMQSHRHRDKHIHRTRHRDT